MLSDPVAEAFGLIHRHPSGENLWYGMTQFSLCACRSDDQTWKSQLLKIQHGVRLG